MAVRRHKDGRSAGNCLAADPADDSRGDIWIADPNGIAFACDALNIKADIDIVTIAFEKVVSGILA